jgi:hypothetical protein
MAVDEALRRKDSEAIVILSNKLLFDCSSFDISEMWIDVSLVFDFVDQNEASERLLILVEWLCRCNKTFYEVLLEEIEAVLEEDAPAPRISWLKMRLFGGAMQTEIEICRAAMTKWVDSDDVSEYLISYLATKSYPPEELTKALFSVSAVNSKVEKGLFRVGCSRMSGEEALEFITKVGNAMNVLNPKTCDLRRVNLLVKAFPSLRNRVLRNTGLSREKAVLLSGISEEMKKYCMKLFNIGEEEVPKVANSGGVESGGGTYFWRKN